MIPASKGRLFECRCKLLVHNVQCYTKFAAGTSPTVHMLLRPHWQRDFAVLVGLFVWHW